MGGDKGEGVGNNYHKTPLTLTLSRKGRGDFWGIPKKSIEGLLNEKAKWARY